MKIAVIKLRSNMAARRDVKDTFSLLKLFRKNNLVVVDDSPSMKGMIAKVKDFVTYGPVSKDVFKEVLEKRGRLSGNKKLKEVPAGFVDAFFEGKKKLKDINVNPVFRLSPPRKGFERGGIRMQYPKGALGNRKEKINDLIKRMI